MNSSFALLAAAHEIARKHAVSISNVTTRWVLPHECVAAAIIGAMLGENEHRADNLKTFSFALDDEDHARLEAIFATLTPIPGEPVSRPHGRVFGRILPANTSVEAKLVGDYAVEIEADAIVSSAGG